MRTAPRALVDPHARVRLVPALDEASPLVVARKEADVVARRWPLPSQALRPTWRVDGRLIVAIALLATGVVGSAVHWGAGSATQPVLALARDMPAGSVLATDDLVVTRVRLDPSTASVVAPAATQARFVGQTLVEPGHAHALLLRAQVQQQPTLDAAHLAFSLPVDPDHASSGQLFPGDEVAVYAVPKSQATGAPDVLVIDHLRVLGVALDRPSSLVLAGAGTAPRLRSLTLAVTDAQARALALAEATGTITVAKHGAAPGLATGAADGP